MQVRELKDALRAKEGDGTLVVHLEDREGKRSMGRFVETAYIDTYGHLRIILKEDNDDRRKKAAVETLREIASFA